MLANTNTNTTIHLHNNTENTMNTIAFVNGMSAGLHEVGTRLLYGVAAVSVGAKRLAKVVWAVNLWVDKWVYPLLAWTLGVAILLWQEVVVPWVDEQVNAAQACPKPSEADIEWAREVWADLTSEQGAELTAPKTPLLSERHQWGEVLDTDVVVTTPPTSLEDKTSAELRKLCTRYGIAWRNANGKNKHMTKGQMVNALRAASTPLPQD